MDELKLCPCCGGKAVVHVGDGVCVICQDCGLRTVSLIDGTSNGKPHGNAIKRVVEKWNKRIKTE